LGPFFGIVAIFGANWSVMMLLGETMPFLGCFWYSLHLPNKILYQNMPNKEITASG